MGKLLTSGELARRFGVAVETVRAWAKKGDIPVAAQSERINLYDPRAVQAAIDKKRRTNTQEEK